MKYKNKFKDNKYKCDYCNTLNFITAYLVKDKCPICNKKLVFKLKIKMRMQLRKGFIKRCIKHEKLMKKYEKSMKERLVEYIYGNNYK